MESDQTGTTPLDGISAADLARILGKLERYLDAEWSDRTMWSWSKSDRIFVPTTEQGSRPTTESSPPVA